MAVIPFDSKEIRDKLKGSFSKLKNGKGADDKTPTTDPKHRREMSDVAKEREKRKEAEATLANATATLEEKTKAAEDLRLLNEQKDVRIKELEAENAELKPVAESARKEEHRRRSILLEGIPKEERKEWQDAPLALLEKYVGKAKTQGSDPSGGGGKPDFKKLINDSGTDDGMKSLNTAIEKHPQAFEEYNKQGVK